MSQEPASGAAQPEDTGFDGYDIFSEMRTLVTVQRGLSFGAEFGGEADVPARYGPRDALRAATVVAISSAARAPKTMASSSEFDARRLAPCSPVAAHSPTVHSPVSEDRARSSLAMPPM